MKHLSKYVTVITGLGLMSVVACSSISGREFQDASLQHKMKYCSAERLKKTIYNQEMDSRCGILTVSENKPKRRFFDGGCDILTDKRCLLGELLG